MLRRIKILARSMNISGHYMRVDRNECIYNVEVDTATIGVTSLYVLMVTYYLIIDKYIIMKSSWKQLYQLTWQ